MGKKKKPYDAEQGQEVALFRYRAIAACLYLEEAPHGERRRLLRRLASTEVTDHLGRRRKIPVGTLKEWIRRYRAEGFDGLHPKKRSDRGQSRRLTDAQVEEILRLRRAMPDLTVIRLQERLVMSGAINPSQVSVPTLHRLFRLHGVTRRDLADSGTGDDVRPYQFGHRNDCWQVDVMVGPSIKEGGRKRRLYLIAFIDDATRIVPAAQFDFHEDTEALAEVLSTGVCKRGIPRRLYSDNGKIFCTRALQLACARLGVEQIHARPYRPEGKGKIERFFRSLRDGFLRPYLVEVPNFSLADINEALNEWLDSVYHVRAHRGLNKKSPIEVWAADDRPLVTPPPNCDLQKLFLSALQRTVRRDCTISFKGRRYETPSAFRNKRVVVRFRSAGDDNIYIQDVDGNLIPLRVVDLVANRTIVRKKPGEA